jgi:predicted DNA-binding transcriptional regulator AlpA
MKEITQWQDVLSEPDVLEVFGMKRSQLDRLRSAKGFPYVKLSHTNRVYLFPDVAEWLCRNRRKISETL